MRIVCWSCEAPYEIAAKALGKFGRPVRCARCTAAWFAAAPAPELELTAEPDEARVAADADTRCLDLGAGALEPLDSSRALVLATVVHAAPCPRPVTIDCAALAPALVPAIESVPRAAPVAIDAAPQDVRTVAPPRAAPCPESRRRSFRFRPAAALVIVGLSAVLAALIAGRTAVVRFAPQTAALFAVVGLPVNLRGLTFDAIRVRRESQDGVPVMVIDGVIANAAGSPVEVPRMRFALHNQAGVEVYTWTALPTRPVLDQGETLPFRTRLASPPADARDVQVRFLNPRDPEIGR
jgi:predicted Zn finger-like uncharacterized protein